MTAGFHRWYCALMTLPSWEIGRALGIPIRVHASWFLVFVFVTWTLATEYLPDALPGLSDSRYWGMGAAAALLLFLSVLLHELGHSYVAQRYRIPIGQITLFLFGGVAQMRAEPPSPKAEFLIAIAGPLVSFALGAFCLGAALAADWLPLSAGGQGFIVLGGLLGVVNVQLGLFNLIPGFPLDGGRALRAGLWAWGRDFHWATSRAALLGLGFGVLLASVGAALIGGAISGMLHPSTASNGGWLMFIGAFLFGAAWSTRRQASLRLALNATSVRDVMIRAVVTIPSQLSLQAAVDEFFVSYGYGSFPVVEEDRIVGFIAVQDVQAISQGLWTWRTVGDVMRPASSELFIQPEWSIMQAMEHMVRTGFDRLVVMEGGRPVGLITGSAVARVLQLHKA
ncbi:MAG TPA: site-2 protease family protein [Nitrospiraceae bacterium]|nr:site-2 protease family protein [Nitrospiraceae bacterium]